MKDGLSTLVVYEDPLDLENDVVVVETEEYTNEFRARRKLKELGFSRVEGDFLLDRLISRLSFSELAKRYQMSNKTMAKRFYSRLVDKLKIGVVRES